MTNSISGPSYFQSFGLFKKAMKIGFLEMLTELQETYGDRVKLMTPNGRVLYLLNDPDDIQVVLQSKAASFIKGKSVAPFKALVGNSLPVSDGEEWKQQRRILQPSFFRQKIASYAPQILKTTEQHIDGWCREGQIDFAKSAARLTHDIVARSLFGADLGAELHSLQKSWEEALDFIYKELHELVKIPLAIPTPRNQKFKRALRTVTDSADKIIRDRLQKNRQSDDDLLSRLILSRQRNEEAAAFSDSEIRNQILAFLFAGHETTASNIAWTIYLLLKNPAIAQEIRAEVDAASLPSEGFTMDHLNALPKLRDAIYESMRLYPPAAVFVRECIEDTEINGRLVKKGGIILISPFIFHRRPDLWENPEAFLPSRFTDDTLKRVGKPKFLAFGYGARACIGEHFAILEGLLVLATILKKMDFTLAQNEVPKTIFSGTMSPSRVEAKVSRRP